MENKLNKQPILSVAIVSICGPKHLTHCLEALATQRNAPLFKVEVVYDPSLHGMESIKKRYPDVRIIANEGQRTPLELASRALLNSKEEVILLTEDHCIPDPDWVSRLYETLEDGNAAVGGVVKVSDNTSSIDWAFYFVDFYRYAPPVIDGSSPTLTVCNVAYRRACLEEIDPSWKNLFHETAVNDNLKARFGPLKLSNKAQVTMNRHVRFSDALRERYVYGRLFGCTRLEQGSKNHRFIYILGAPALPIVIMARMIRKAIINKSLSKKLFLSILPLSCMVLAWSWGEWLGYITRRRPQDLTAAQEIID